MRYSTREQYGVLSIAERRGRFAQARFLSPPTLPWFCVYIEYATSTATRCVSGVCCVRERNHEPAATPRRTMLSIAQRQSSFWD
mgnify:FL=1